MLFNFDFRWSWWQQQRQTSECSVFLCVAFVAWLRVLARGYYYYACVVVVASALSSFVEEYEEMETWRNVKRGNTVKLQLMRNARAISLAYLYRCGLCRKDVTRNLHPSGEFQISCFFGFWGNETCSFSFCYCYPPLKLDYSCKKGERFPNFSLKSRLPTSETLIVSERGFIHVWRGIGLFFKALSWSYQFRSQSVSLSMGNWFWD